jgi:hypothetical protein
MKKTFDKTWVGVVLGIIGATIGFVLFGFYGASTQDVSWSHFIHTVFIDRTMLQFQDKVVTISILLDVLLFFIFMRLEWNNLCKGLLGVVIAAVPVAVYLY